LDEEYSKRRHWETEFHRVNRDIQGSRDLGADSRTEFHNSTKMGRDERQRSRSRGSTTKNVDSRQFVRRPTNQRGGTPRPSDNMNRMFHGVRRDVQESQGRDGGEGHPDTYTRGIPPKMGMQSLVFRGGRGAPRGMNKTFHRQLRKKGCFKCDNFLNCKKGTCPASIVTCNVCCKVGHLPSKCWKNQK